eukprot:1154495-Pelagomonas_calceolata.AAC.1
MHVDHNWHDASELKLQCNLSQYRRLPVVEGTYGPLFGLPRAITKTHYARKPAINCSRAANDLSMTSYIKPECSAKDMAEALIKLGIASI